jgi:hypothetical protein
VSARGIYGLGLTGLPDHAAIAAAVPAAPAHWPEIRITLTHDVSAPPDEAWEQWDDGVVTLGVPGGGNVVIRRDGAEAELGAPGGVALDWLVHPALAYVGAVFAGWLGRCAFHAAAFVAGGGAWGLLGGYEAGKSSTVGWLERSGHTILADDMIVIEDGTAFAGPRAIDLRPATAGLVAFQGAGGVVRGGFRTRVKPRPVPPEVPMRGWFALRWHDDPSVVVRPVESSGERLEVLVDNLHHVCRPNHADLFDLLELPLFEILRPRTLSSLPETARAVLRTAAEHDGTPAAVLLN